MSTHLRTVLQVCGLLQLHEMLEGREAVQTHWYV